MSSSLQLQSLSPLLERSEKFSSLNRYGSSTTRCQELLQRGEEEKLLLDNANSSYPLLHHSVLQLSIDFLKLKQKHGTHIEKELYRNISIEAFVDRLLRWYYNSYHILYSILSKRPLMFVGQLDTYILRDSGGQEGVLPETFWQNHSDHYSYRPKTFFPEIF